MSNILIKSLRRKDNKEFIHIDYVDGFSFIYTCTIPQPLNENVTMNDLIDYHKDVVFDDYELILFELIEK